MPFMLHKLGQLSIKKIKKKKVDKFDQKKYYKRIKISEKLTYTTMTPLIAWRTIASTIHAYAMLSTS
jgi:hypothetical protein